jgi:hypothetical protein
LCFVLCALLATLSSAAYRQIARTRLVLVPSLLQEPQFLDFGLG